MNLLRRIYDPFIKIATGANAVGALVIFILVATMNVDVVARGIFHAPFRGVVEVVIYSLILIVFLQLPDVVRSNRLTRSDGFLGLSQKRFPAFGNTLARLIDFASAVFMGLIAWTMWPEFFESFETCHFFSAPEFGPPPTGDLLTDLSDGFARCEYFGTPGIFTAPWWPAKLAIGFSVSLCCVIFLFKSILGDRQPATLDPGEKPV